MSNANRTFELLLGSGPAATREKTTLGVPSIDAVADYLRPGRPDVKLVKRGYTTWQVRSGGRIVGSVQQLS
jgi:hypothetical protein